MMKKQLKKIVSAFHQFSGIFDMRFQNNKIDLKYPPIFILGAPRSGTTLLYQILMAAFKFSYLPNISNRFYNAPVSAQKIGKAFCHTYRPSFESKYGFEKGCMAPSEAGNIWNRWFPHENKQGFNYTTADYLDTQSTKEIFQLVANTELTFNAPFITKNVKMGVRIPSLERIFVKPLYVFINREKFDTVLSNLVMRRTRKVSWASVMPKEINDIVNLPEIEQVCKQIVYVENNIKQDFAEFGCKVMNVNYDVLCSEPQEFINEFESFVNQNQIVLEKKDFTIPHSFPVSKTKQTKLVTAVEMAEIRQILKDLEK